MSAMETTSRGNLGHGYVKEDEGLDLGLGLDRISELPREILSHIFSFLSMEDYTKTMLVSKTWKSIWSPRTSVLELDFKSFYITLGISNPAEREKRFAQFVERMTVLHMGLHLQELKFGLDVTLFRMGSSLIRNWITLASTTNPSTLDLKVYGIPYWSVDPYRVLCSCVGQSVTLLKFTFGSFTGNNLFEYLESVKTVILNAVHLSENAINRLIRKCPALEELHIVECYHPPTLYIDAVHSRLQCLVLELSFNCQLRVLGINIPSLVKLKFEGKMLEDFHAGNLRNVLEAEIYILVGYNSRRGNNMLYNLLAGINNVNTLTMCTCSLKHYGSQALLRNQDGTLQIQLNSLKKLTVNSYHGCSCELKGLSSLLKSSPYLESLSVILKQKLVKYKVGLSSFRCLHHLKKVEIVGFDGDCSLLEFVKYLLENALVLETMIIYKPTRESTFASLDQSQERAIYGVSAFRRARPDAQVLIL